MCRTPFYALLQAGFPLALIAAFLYGQFWPLALWVAVVFHAAAEATRSKK